jgi:hypothetical protein
MSLYCGLPVGGAAMRTMSVIAIVAASVISVPALAGELFLNPRPYVYPGFYPGPYPGFGVPPYGFPRAREAAPRTARALDGVRNGATREERDRHGGPEIDLTGRPVLTGRYREFQF